MPDKEDEYIKSVEDPDTQADRRWNKYLKRLRSGAYGDHISAQALAEVLKVQIEIISTSAPDTETLLTPGGSHVDIKIILGHVGQFHYVALEAIEEHNTFSGTAVREARQDHTSLQEYVPDDSESIEDEEAFKHQVQLRGLSYETCLQKENVDANGENTYSIAPGEGQKPIGILKDDFFEEMCNPTKYPTGEGGLLSNRKKLTVQLSKIPHHTVSTVIVGDFNSDILSPPPSNLLHLMSANGFSQLVTAPTTDSGSLIDHIYYNGCTTNTFVDVVDTYYSDHDATFLSLPAP